ncbi:deoxyribose-phosphate aldolase [Clostridium beijerinckii]|uniref:Deoxyribose-phosphate aldolase n=1 Tax=Clostridium beijerinckii TaxID=1520 RepID=A0AB74VAL3_CLOBE|nr:deoxyribose-phosphate aldolase [Clostridium beijerinckii]NRZ27651.1 deoxyribose-phosphate aldolase [Clostridium beijerinckii]NYB96563.1 deoxyribose-phosphate aldolase [Clostridium beijerinckii]OOM25091.1 deoxyribose-phosphate aldolase 1 [Clostridium beijerinckii]QUN33454.1 deoxyribose-phosphate aldolase [Clostridium beijerinckii]SQB01236.1 deoxyribose-phosphate aldolase [Clostridium beijerinckii]
MNIAKYMDHTILKPEAAEEDVKRLCREAKEYSFASVCVNGCYAKLVSTELVGSEVKTCVVVGFPLGAMTKEAKAFETSQAIENGASEIDMVINVGALKDKNYSLLKDDIEAVVNAAKGKALVKVIIETCLLTDEEKVKACEIAKEAKADFVKTSTGFSTGGATKEDIALMRKTVGPDLGVKASGGVRDFKAAMDMINVGASRIGSSNSIAIVNESK